MNTNSRDFFSLSDSLFFWFLPFLERKTRGLLSLTVSHPSGMLINKLPVYYVPSVSFFAPLALKAISKCARRRRRSGKRAREVGAAFSSLVGGFRLSVSDRQMTRLFRLLFLNTGPQLLSLTKEETNCYTGRTYTPRRGGGMAC